MVSLWGSAKDDGNNQDHGVSASDTRNPRGEGQSSHEPDERTRLLPSRRPPTGEGYLDPDDPAVSILQRRQVHSYSVDICYS